jgi:hypothetical protein
MTPFFNPGPNPHGAPTDPVVTAQVVAGLRGDPA